MSVSDALALCMAVLEDVRDNDLTENENACGAINAALKKAQESLDENQGPD